jgi:hypothetical protein
VWIDVVEVTHSCKKCKWKVDGWANENVFIQPGEGRQETEEGKAETVGGEEKGGSGGLGRVGTNPGARNEMLKRSVTWTDQFPGRGSIGRRSLCPACEEEEERQCSFELGWRRQKKNRIQGVIAFTKNSHSWRKKKRGMRIPEKKKTRACWNDKI